MGQELLKGDYIPADGQTIPVDMQMHDANHHAYLGDTIAWRDLTRASSKVMVTGLTIMSAEPESSMQRAGRMPSESSSTRSKSIPKIRARSGRGTDG